ncbi:Bug family tripartite tricarboxylate transporter substrate binding protein [Polaromonas hydrogenivorans]|uniref:Bug family tripartite tricarboxylate transporter substrate binding protein n=1 Tax=Polaromonas hydrogenivorans TaxID=335476 RepID=A0AAU7LXY8_9BURK
MTISRRRILQSTFCATPLLQFGPCALAQPGEIARIITGFPPGGTTDAISRRLAEKLQPGYARNVIVENRSGAGGQLAVQSMKSAPVDGATILFTPMSILGVYPHTYKRLPYDPVADLIPVSNVATYDYGLAVGPAVPANVTTVPQFMDWCKANPTKANFGSGATGSTLHFLGIILGRAAGIELTHVGYRGSASMLSDLAGGSLPACCSPVGDLLAYQAAGRLRVIGTSGSKRSRFLPKVATFAEYGYTDMVFNEWYGLFLAARTPQEYVQRLNTAVAGALAAPDVINALALLGMDATPSSSIELDAMLKIDTERWGKLVKSTGFTSET